MNRALSVLLKSPVLYAVFLTMISTATSISTAYAEDKKGIQERLSDFSEILKSVNDKTGEVSGVLEGRVAKVNKSVSHSLYDPPFRVRKGSVVLFTGPLCGPCDDAKRFLMERRIAHKIVDVTETRRGKRQYEKLGNSGVPVMLFLGRRMDGFSAADFDCAAATPAGQAADCDFRPLNEVEEAE